MKPRVITILSALILITTIQAMAIQASQQGMGREPENSEQQGARRGPPPEAYSACEGKSAGVTAEMVTPRGDSVTGTCEEERDGKLVLRPERTGKDARDKRRVPPPEAYSACEGKSSGDRAELTTPRGDKLRGICKEDHTGRLVLRPDQPKEKHLD